MATCIQCKSQFHLNQAEKDFFKKIKLPEPIKCPDCRRQRRFAFRNERKLYYRKCDLTGKQIVSIYAPDSPYTVYDQHEWHSDKWDGLDYGRDFDFSRPFFEQMNELMLAVPKLSVFTSRNENSDFTNGAQQDRNCYMIFVSDHNEDCYYSYAIDSCKDCAECFNCYKCTLCLECIDCSDSYNIVYSQKAHNCSDGYFLSDCKNCRNCCACYGLRNKKYCILNKQYSKKEYEEKLAALNFGNYDKLMEMKTFFESKSKEQQIYQYIDGNNNENSTGDHIVGCKNCIECYDSGDLQDCGYLIYSFKSRDCFDGHVVVDNCELCYETISTINQYNTQFTFVAFYSKNSMYLDHCYKCENCFGCSGLKNKKYCILNKQYSKEEYEELIPRIIKHMGGRVASPRGERAGERESGYASSSEAELKNKEFGQPFPISLSPFAYNETTAYEYFPLTKEEVLERGWKWRDEEKEDSAYQGPKYEMPKNIEDVSEDIVDKILICEKTGKLYKLVPQELNLYKRHKLPLPRNCFEERHLTRIAQRNPKKLYERKCMKCGNKIWSTYALDRPEKVYCESCYEKAMY